MYCFVFGTHPQTRSINKRAIDFTRDIHMMHTSPKHDLDLIIIIYPWKLAVARKRKKEQIIKSGNQEQLNMDEDGKITLFIGEIC